MQIVLDHIERPGVFELPEGITKEKICRVLQNGFPISFGNYSFLRGNKIQISCCHPAKQEKFEVEVIE